MENTVAPLAGAWIEIGKPIPTRISAAVAPLAGAWIEIDYIKHSGDMSRTF